MTKNQILDTKKLTKKHLRRPQMYQVVIMNDDNTTFETVIDIGIKVFGMSEDDAHCLTLEVHLSGCARIGPFTYDVADTKSIEATDMARVKEEPLMVDVEPIGKNAS